MVINAIWGGGEGNVWGINMDWCDCRCYCVCVKLPKNVHG